MQDDLKRFQISASHVESPKYFYLVYCSPLTKSLHTCALIAHNSDHDKVLPQTFYDLHVTSPHQFAPFSCDLFHIHHCVQGCVSNSDFNRIQVHGTGSEIQCGRADMEGMQFLFLKVRKYFLSVTEVLFEEPTSFS